MSKLESTSALLVIAVIVVVLSIVAFDHHVFAAVMTTIGFSCAGAVGWYSIVNIDKNEPNEFEN